MFRHFAIPESVEQIHQIRVNAEILQKHYSKRSLSSKLAILLHSIDEFEKYRTLDFLEDNNDRGMQVLHAAIIYLSHYRKHLTHCALHFEASALVSSLTAYLRDVVSQIREVNASIDQLCLTLEQQGRNNQDRLTALRYQQKKAAEMREETLNAFLLKTAETNSYDYFGITDALFTDETMNEEAIAEAHFANAEKVWVNELYQTNTMQREDELSASDIAVTIEIDNASTEDQRSHVSTVRDVTIEEFSLSYNDSDAEDEQAFYADRSGDEDDQDEDNEYSGESMTSSHSSQHSPRLYGSVRHRPDTPRPSLKANLTYSSNSDSERDSDYSSSEMQALLPRKLL